MNALVTGGAGFVGRHVVKRLVWMGYHVLIVDNFYPGSGCQELDAWMPHLQPDRSKITLVKDDCRNFFRHHNSYSREFDVVVHLAAVVGGRLVIENDPLAVGIDISIDAEFFHWLSRLSYRPYRVYYFSSSASYPVAYQKPDSYRILSEDMIAFTDGFIGQPDLTYGWAKLTGEFLARLASQKHGLHITCFRPFSGYGEDQDLSYPFPAILKRAVNGEDPITVWGSGYQMRDFIYIEDCIDGMFILGDKIGDGSGVNLSTGIPTSFNELALKMFEIANGKLPSSGVRGTTGKPEGVFARYGSTELQSQLGFRHRYSLEDGIRLCLKYWKEYGIC